MPSPSPIHDGNGHNQRTTLKTLTSVNSSVTIMRNQLLLRIPCFAETSWGGLTIFMAGSFHVTGNAGARTPSYLLTGDKQRRHFVAPQAKVYTITQLTYVP
jgi:hypothetical protein